MHQPDSLRIGLLFEDTGYDIDGIRRQLAPHAVEQVIGWSGLQPAALAERCRSYDAVVTGRRSPALPEALIADRGRLRLLAHIHGTIKHLVSKAHVASGLKVSNWGDQVAGVAESAFTLLLMAMKQVHGLDAYIRRDWQDDRRIWQDFPATLHGRDIGLYGFGPIGRHMGNFLHAFGAHVAIYDPYAKHLPDWVRQCDSLRALFSSCQCVSIHCGLNDGTRNTVTRELLELLPQGGVLINTARGPIVVEDDLAAVLASGRIVAGLDVICDEKHWATSVFARLPSDRVLLTGHVAGNGKGPAPDSPVRTQRLLPDYVADNLIALAGGRPLRHLITAEIYDLKT
ncbi:dehydrogenase [Planctomycetota bacterium]|nr:dehydrogenase [Planctomycetota bacterium]